MPKVKQWTREELLVAFYLYTRIPFGRFHSKNPEIINFAESLGRTPSALAMKLSNIASLDPAQAARGIKGLKGASQSDKAMWNEMHENWDQFALDAMDAVQEFNQDIPSTQLNEEEFEYAAEDREAKTRVRIGQGFFRNAVLSSYDFQCCISGIQLTELLVASHIVPWSHDSSNRLNPRNGLALSAIHDRAFDRGLIGFDEKLRMIASKQVKNASNPFIDASILQYEGKTMTIPAKFPPDLELLRYHREKIFCDGSA
jgi:putative restriction endonuclease